MHQIDTTGAVTSMPTPNPVGSTVGWFNHGNASTGEPFTVLSSDWCNAVQGELKNVIQAAGITLDKTNNAQLLAALNKLGRIKVAVGGSLDVYVNASTGNDANDGLTTGTAKASIQAAVDMISENYDVQGVVPTVHVADGTYTTGVTLSPLVGGLGLTLVGNTSTPMNCKIALSGAGACCTALSGAHLSVSGFALESTHGSGGSPWDAPGCGLAAWNGGQIGFDNIAFGQCSVAHINGGTGVIVTNFAGAPVSIYGDAAAHMLVGIPGATVNVSGADCQILNAVSISVFANAAGPCMILASGAVYGGASSVTGQKYTVGYGALITVGGDINFFPGTVAGDSFTGTAAAGYYA